MRFNVAKSVIIRFGKNASAVCKGVVINNVELSFVKKAKYLGMFLVSAHRFKLSFSEARTKFFKAFNGLLYKSKRCMNETVMFQLVNAFCLPFLTYCCESIVLLRSECSMLQYTWNAVYYKLFNIRDLALINDVNEQLGWRLLTDVIQSRRHKFLLELRTSSNSVMRDLSWYGL
jgi:hypothetical protein